MLVKILSYRSFVIFLSLCLLLLFLAYSLTFLVGCQKQSAPPVSKVEPPPAAETPQEPPQPSGHFHADGTWHEDPHEPPAEEVAATPPPAVAVPDNPDGLPYPMTDANRDIWIARVTEALNNPALLEQLLPATKERAFETQVNLAYCGSMDQVGPFRIAMWRKMAALYPNDGDILYQHAVYLPRKTLAEKREYADVWERLKRINDEEGIPITSGRRKTHSLSQYYLDLGEDEKALENMIEQSQRLIAIRQAGIHDMHMYHGLLVRGSNSEIAGLRQALREIRVKKGKKE